MHLTLHNEGRHVLLMLMQGFFHCGRSWNRPNGLMAATVGAGMRGGGAGRPHLVGRELLLVVVLLGCSQLLLKPILFPNLRMFGALMDILVPYSTLAVHCMRNRTAVHG